MKDYNPKNKRIHARRYRRHIRQDVKQWRNRYYYGILRGCNTCDCMEELWDDDDGVVIWPSCLSFKLEPEYDPRNKWINPYDICDWRFYCKGPEYRRK
jgi:hypothetical protein